MVQVYSLEVKMESLTDSVFGVRIILEKPKAHRQLMAWKGDMKDTLAELFKDKPLVIPPQKPIALVPKPANRPTSWIKYGDLVIFVIIDDKGKPRMRTGHICSWPGSHGASFEVDNVAHTIVWSDQELRMADCADDAFEEGFDPKDPNLLRLDELEPLKNPETAVTWFQGVYSPEIARQISVLVSKPDFGREDELKEEAEESKLAEESAKRKLGWWDFEKGVFHPPVEATA